MNQLQLTSLGVLFLTAACASQPPAPIAHKGNKFYGKEGVVALAEKNRPVTETRAVAAAPVETMVIADLPEPTPEPKIVAKPTKPIAEAKPQPQFKTASFGDEAPVVAAEPNVQEIASLEPLPLETLDMTPVNPVVKAVREEKSGGLAKVETRNSNFIWPASGPVVSSFGPKKNGLVNDGINIAASEGEPIWAAADGEVVYAGNELKGYGNMMIIRHKNGWMTAYAHASDMLITKGDQIGQGDLIGYVGQTGAVDKPQLHFGIREGKTPVDPENLLPRRVASAQ